MTGLLLLASDTFQSEKLVFCLRRYKAKEKLYDRSCYRRWKKSDTIYFI